MNQVLTILGQSYEIPQERVNYNIYRNNFVQFAKKSCEEFINFYMTNAGDITNLLSVSEKYGKEIINNALKYAVSGLIAKGIYDVDRYYIVENAIESVDYFNNAVDNVQKKINSIEAELKKAEATRNAQVNSASNSWTGGGSGIEGALMGAAQAAVLNAASGAITKAVTSGDVKNALSVREQKLLNLLNNGNTAEKLGKALYNDIFAIFKTYVDILDKRSADVVKNISEEEIRKSRAIYNNLADGLYGDAELAQKMWVQMFVYYPYNPEYFTLFLLQYEENFNEVITNADWYNIPMKNIVSSLLESRYNFSGVTDLEVAESMKASLMNDMNKYSVTETPLLSLADNCIENIINDKSTYKGVRYESEEQRMDAEALDNEIRAMIMNVNRNDLQALMYLYFGILNGYADRNYIYIKRENAVALSSIICENITNVPNPKEMLMYYANYVNADPNFELNQGILKALNKKLGQINRSEKMSNFTGFFKNK